MYKLGGDRIAEIHIQTLAMPPVLRFFKKADKSSIFHSNRIQNKLGVCENRIQKRFTLTDIITKSDNLG